MRVNMTLFVIWHFSKNVCVLYFGFHVGYNFLFILRTLWVENMDSSTQC
jgi:hypothetical protein